MRFYSSSDLPIDLAQKSFAANIARKMPNGTAPLFAMTGLAKKKMAKDIEHGYWTKSMQFTQVTITAEAAAVDTVLEVATTMGILPNQVIRVARPFVGGLFQAPEYLRVLSVDHGASTISVERGFADTTALALIPAGTKVPVLANAHPEGSPRPVSRAIVPERVMNYTQIFRNAWSQSRTLAAIQQIVGKGTVAENRADCAAFHASDIEFSILMGRKSLDVDSVTGEPIHTMDGLEAIIETHAPTNLREAGTTTNYDQLEDLLDPVLDFKTDFMQGNERTVFCGKQALKVINQIGRLSGEYQIRDGQTRFGLRFSTFTTTRGVFHMVEHPLLNTNEEYQKMAFVVDLSSFELPYLEGRDTQVEMINGNMQSTDGTDATGGIMTTEVTTEIMNPFACGIIYNLRQASM